MRLWEQAWEFGTSVCSYAHSKLGWAGCHLPVPQPHRDPQEPTGIEGSCGGVLLASSQNSDDDMNLQRKKKESRGRAEHTEEPEDPLVILA